MARRSTRVALAGAWVLFTLQSAACSAIYPSRVIYNPSYGLPEPVDPEFPGEPCYEDEPPMDEVLYPNGGGHGEGMGRPMGPPMYPPMFRPPYMDSEEPPMDYVLPPEDDGCGRICDFSHAGDGPRPVEVVHTGCPCTCREGFPIQVERVAEAPPQRLFSYGYRVERPPRPQPCPCHNHEFAVERALEPLPVRLYDSNYRVEIPRPPPPDCRRNHGFAVEKPLPRPDYTTHDMPYSVQTVPEAAPCPLRHEEFTVERPASFPESRLCGLTAAVDRVVLPAPDCPETEALTLGRIPCADPADATHAALAAHAAHAALGAAMAAEGDGPCLDAPRYARSATATSSRAAKERASKAHQQIAPRTPHEDLIHPGRFHHHDRLTSNREAGLRNVHLDPHHSARSRLHHGSLSDGVRDIAFNERHMPHKPSHGEYAHPGRFVTHERVSSSHREANLRHPFPPQFVKTRDDLNYRISEGDSIRALSFNKRQTESQPSRGEYEQTEIKDSGEKFHNKESDTGFKTSDQVGDRQSFDSYNVRISEGDSIREYPINKRRVEPQSSHTGYDHSENVHDKEKFVSANSESDKKHLISEKVSQRRISESEDVREITVSKNQRRNKSGNVEVFDDSNKEKLQVLKDASRIIIDRGNAGEPLDDPEVKIKSNSEETLRFRRGHDIEEQFVKSNDHAQEKELTESEMKGSQNANEQIDMIKTADGGFELHNDGSDELENTDMKDISEGRKTLDDFLERETPISPKNPNTHSERTFPRKRYVDDTNLDEAQTEVTIEKYPPPATEIGYVASSVGSTVSDAEIIKTAIIKHHEDDDDNSKECNKCKSPTKTVTVTKTIITKKSGGGCSGSVCGESKDEVPIVITTNDEPYGGATDPDKNIVTVTNVITDTTGTVYEPSASSKTITTVSNSYAPGIESSNADGSIGSSNYDYGRNSGAEIKYTKSNYEDDHGYEKSTGHDTTNYNGVSKNSFYVTPHHKYDSYGTYGGTYNGRYGYNPKYGKSSKNYGPHRYQNYARNYYNSNSHKYRPDEAYKSQYKGYSPHGLRYGKYGNSYYSSSRKPNPFDLHSGYKILDTDYGTDRYSSSHASHTHGTKSEGYDTQTGYSDTDDVTGYHGLLLPKSKHYGSSYEYNSNGDRKYYTGKHTSGNVGYEQGFYDKSQREKHLEYNHKGHKHEGIFEPYTSGVSVVEDGYQGENDHKHHESSHGYEKDTKYDKESYQIGYKYNSGHVDGYQGEKYHKHHGASHGYEKDNNYDKELLYKSGYKYDSGNVDGYKGENYHKHHGSYHEYENDDNYNKELEYQKGFEYSSGNDGYKDENYHKHHGSYHGYENNDNYNKELEHQKGFEYNSGNVDGYKGENYHKHHGSYHGYEKNDGYNKEIEYQKGFEYSTGKVNGYDGEKYNKHHGSSHEYGKDINYDNVKSYEGGYKHGSGKIVSTDNYSNSGSGYKTDYGHHDHSHGHGYNEHNVALFDSSDIIHEGSKAKHYDDLSHHSGDSYTEIHINEEPYAKSKELLQNYEVKEEYVGDVHHNHEDKSKCHESCNLQPCEKPLDESVKKCGCSKAGHGEIITEVITEYISEKLPSTKVTYDDQVASYISNYGIGKEILRDYSGESVLKDNSYGVKELEYEGKIPVGSYVESKSGLYDSDKYFTAKLPDSGTTLQSYGNYGKGYPSGYGIDYGSKTLGNSYKTFYGTKDSVVGPNDYTFGKQILEGFPNYGSTGFITNIGHDSFDIRTPVQGSNYYGTDQAHGFGNSYTDETQPSYDTGVSLGNSYDSATNYAFGNSGASIDGSIQVDSKFGLNIFDNPQNKYLEQPGFIKDDKYESPNSRKYFNLHNGKGFSILGISDGRSTKIGLSDLTKGIYNKGGDWLSFDTGYGFDMKEDFYGPITKRSTSGTGQNTHIDMSHGNKYFEELPIDQKRISPNKRISAVRDISENYAYPFFTKQELRAENQNQQYFDSQHDESKHHSNLVRVKNAEGNRDVESTEDLISRDIRHTRRNIKHPFQEINNDPSKEEEQMSVFRDERSRENVPLTLQVSSQEVDKTKDYLNGEIERKFEGNHESMENTMPPFITELKDDAMVKQSVGEGFKPEAEDIEHTESTYHPGVIESASSIAVGSAGIPEQMYVHKPENNNGEETMFPDITENSSSQHVPEIRNDNTEDVMIDVLEELSQIAEEDKDTEEEDDEEIKKKSKSKS